MTWQRDPKPVKYSKFFFCVLPRRTGRRTRFERRKVAVQEASCLAFLSGSWGRWLFWFVLFKQHAWARLSPVFTPVNLSRVPACCSSNCWLLRIVTDYMVVSKNRGTPKSSSLIRFSSINQPLLGTPINGNRHIVEGHSHLGREAEADWKRPRDRCSVAGLPDWTICVRYWMIYII